MSSLWNRYERSPLYIDFQLSVGKKDVQSNKALGKDSFMLTFHNDKVTLVYRTYDNNTLGEKLM
jgi:hypothetical protein